jgi:hypothetical protein
VKYFKSLLLLLALAFSLTACNVAFAQEAATAPTVSEALTAEIAKMDDAKKAEVLKSIQTPAASESARRAKEWVDVGAGIGESLAATAGKLGVEVNKFAQTPVGKMAMVLIVWHYMGEEISGWVCGLLFWLIFLPMWFYAARKTMGVYNEKGKFVRFDKELFYDKTQYGVLPLIFLVSLVLIVFVGIVFIA